MKLEGEMKPRIPEAKYTISGNKSQITHTTQSKIHSSEYLSSSLSFETSLRTQIKKTMKIAATSNLKTTLIRTQRPFLDDQHATHIARDTLIIK